MQKHESREAPGMPAQTALRESSPKREFNRSKLYGYARHELTVNIDSRSLKMCDLLQLG